MDLEARRSGIGGSDVGAILGYNAIPGACVYKTATEVWDEKVNGYSESRTARPDDYKTAQLWWGVKLEPLLLEAYQYFEETEEVQCGKSVGQVAHPDNPWLIANVDGVSTVNGKKIVVEIKNSDRGDRNVWGDAETDQVPLGYYMQVQHYMYVLGLEEARIVARVRGDTLIYHIMRDDDLIEGMVKKLSEFWHENVLKKVPPKAEKLSDVKLSYKASDDDSVILAGEDEFDKINEAKEIVAKLEVVKKEMEAKKTELAEMMREKIAIVNEDGKKLVTFKPRKDGVRVFKIN